MTAQLRPIPGLPLLSPHRPRHIAAGILQPDIIACLPTRGSELSDSVGPPFRLPLYARSNSGLLPTLPQMCRRFPAGVFPAIRPQRHVVFGARPCPPPRLALALTRPPARCFPCALRELRGSAFPVPSTRNLPRKQRAAAALNRRDFLWLPSQKAPLALGSRAHSRRVARGVPSEIRTIQIRRKRKWHSTKTASGLKAF
jgi:hypothetical protein